MIDVSSLSDDARYEVLAAIVTNARAHLHIMADDAAHGRPEHWADGAREALVNAILDQLGRFDLL